jgi:hypothetical protein
MKFESQEAVLMARHNQVSSVVEIIPSEQSFLSETFVFDNYRLTTARQKRSEAENNQRCQGITFITNKELHQKNFPQTNKFKRGNWYLFGYDMFDRPLSAETLTELAHKMYKNYAAVRHSEALLGYKDKD